MEPREVVTAFLTDGARILLLLRSGFVSTYRGRWAGVSGYREPCADPEAQARREIAEETGLPERDLEFLRAGPPQAVLDPAEGRSWLVHPFLFRVLRPEAVRLDWENRAAEWVAPGEVLLRPTVPALARVLGVVLPLPGRTPEERTFRAAREEARNEIARDRVSGASALADRALREAAAWAGCPGVSPREGVGEGTVALSVLRPAMAPVRNAALHFLERFEDRCMGVPDALKCADSCLGELSAERAAAAERTAEAAARRLCGARRIVTLSRSGTVLALCRTLVATGAFPEVLLLESRPGGEAELMAEEVRGTGLRVELVPDTAVREAALRTEAAVCGADSLYADGSYANKTGSRALVQAAAAARVPVLVLAGPWKRRYGPGWEPFRDGDAFDPERAEGNGGPLFERVPAGLPFEILEGAE